MSLMLITPATQEPVSLVELKSHARISHSDEDQLLEQLCRAARAHLEWATGWSLAPQLWQQEVHFTVLGESPLLRKPFISFHAATILCPDQDPMSISTEELMLTPKGALHTKTITALRKGCCLQVQYMAGSVTGKLPSDLKQALLVLTSYFYENRESLRSPSDAALATGIMPLIAPYREVSL